MKGREKRVKRDIYGEKRQLRQGEREERESI